MVEWPGVFVRFMAAVVAPVVYDHGSLGAEITAWLVECPRGAYEADGRG